MPTSDPKFWLKENATSIFVILNTAQEKGPHKTIRLKAPKRGRTRAPHHPQHPQLLFRIEPSAQSARDRPPLRPRNMSVPVAAHLARWFGYWWFGGIPGYLPLVSRGTRGSPITRPESNSVLRCPVAMTKKSTLLLVGCCKGGPSPKKVKKDKGHHWATEGFCGETRPRLPSGAMPPALRAPPAAAAPQATPPPPAEPALPAPPAAPHSAGLARRARIDWSQGAMTTSPGVICLWVKNAQNGSLVEGSMD